MRTKLIKSSMLLLVAMVAGFWPGPAAWSKPNVEERLERGDIIVNFQASEKSKVHDVVGEILLDASPEAVWSILTDYSNFSSAFPDITKTEVLERKGNTVQVKIVNKNAWPYLDYVYILQFTEDKPGLSLACQMVGKGSFQNFAGAAVMKPFKGQPEKTHLIYTLSRDFGWMVPTLNADLDTRAVVVNRLSSLRKQIREQNQKQGKNPDADAQVQPKWSKANYWWEKDDATNPQNAKAQKDVKKSKPADDTRQISGELPKKDAKHHDPTPPPETLKNEAGPKDQKPKAAPKAEVPAPAKAKTDAGPKGEASPTNAPGASKPKGFDQSSNAAPDPDQTKPELKSACGQAAATVVKDPIPSEVQPNDAKSNSAN